MASTPLLSFRPSSTRVSAASRKSSSFSSSSAGAKRGANWWAPIFGWSPEPDYIDGGDGRQTEGAADPGPGRRARFAAFTEEKARELRIRTMESSTFHDAMYHSAIAARLASDVHGHDSDV